MSTAQSLLCLVAGVVCAVVYLSLFTKNSWSERSKREAVDQFPLLKEGTSFWCKGNNISDRTCKFKNLCYSAEHDDFVFLHGKHSALEGVPENRFDPEFVTLSSVLSLNTYYFKYVDLPVESLDSFDDVKLVFDSTVFIFKRFLPVNLMHLLHDDLLPLLVTLQSIDTEAYGSSYSPSSFIQLFFTDDYGENAFFELYKTLTALPPLLKTDLVRDNRPNQKSLLCFRRGYIGVSKSTVWYQYGYDRPQGPVPTMASVKQISYLADFITKNLKPAPDESTHNYRHHQPLVVLLSRKANRLILNELDLVMALSNLFNATVVAVSLETHTLSDHLRYIRSAQVLVGVHGSLLSLAMFLPSGSLLIEIFPYAIDPLHYTPYRTLSGLPGVNVSYVAWANTVLANTVTHEDNPAELGGISHLSEEERRLIVTSHQVPLHLCCKDPEWLYRIYQDTIVDIPSFIDTVRRRPGGKTANAKGKVDGLADHNLYPGEVRSIQCRPESSQGIVLAWKTPWNVAEFIPTALVRYEVLMAEDSSTDSVVTTAYIMPSEECTFSELKPCAPYDFWVRCIINENIKGPYTHINCKSTCN